MNRFLRLGLLGILSIAIVSCGGSLSKEQREKAKKAIEEGQIKRITPADLTETAMSLGKSIAMKIVEVDPYLNNPAFIDSIAKANQVAIYSLKPGIDGLSEEENSVAEAYQAEGDVAGVGGNVQKLGGDSLLYTQPVGNERPDGSKPFSHAIAIKMSVKQIVLSIEE